MLTTYFHYLLNQEILRFAQNDNDFYSDFKKCNAIKIGKKSYFINF